VAGLGQFSIWPLLQVHRGHHLSCTAMPIDGGRYQARVAIANVRRGHTRTPSYLDLEVLTPRKAIITQYAEVSRG
jgi:hypothetical protein